VKFKKWKIWLKSKPWLLKWFIILVLLRPIIDNLYFLKEISPFLSPLYIVGVLTPILVLYVIAKFPKPKRSKLDKYVKIWSLFLFIGIFFVIIYDPLSIDSFEYLLKLSIPVYIYFFARVFIQNKQDLDGILTTFLYSGIFVAMLLLYELFFGAIRTVESRGMERLQGSFGDVVSYGIYLSFCFLVVTYFYFSRKGEIPKRKRTRLVFIVGGLCLLTLVNIHHVASYTIFIAILLLFMVFNFRENKGAAVVFSFLFFLVFYLFGQPLIEDKITPLLQTDISVYEGDKGSEKLLHGRVGRWTSMFETFTNESIFAQFFGYPLSLNRSYQYVGVGSHNDFVRMLFLSGYFGLFYYLVLLIMFFKRAKKLTSSLKYLAFGTLGILMLYSISIVPTYYPPFMYVVMSVFAFVALPKKLQGK
jgi:O-antigen ligase